MNIQTISPGSTDTDDASVPAAGWAEQVVPPLVVIAISVAGMLASLMQPQMGTPQPVPASTRALADAPQLGPALADADPRF